MSQIPAQKVPVLIASTLKPIWDIRAYGKLALSLGETNKYRLNIIGFSPKKPKSASAIRFFSSMRHFDSIWDRILAQPRFLICLLKVRPKVLICCTYEFLPIASFFKSLVGYKLVYDVQENYLANLDLNPALSFKKKGKAIRLIQKAESVKGIDLYLLAEKCYADEMPEKRPFLILENKFHGEIVRKNPFSLGGKKKFRFCISGTITPAFGIWEALIWFKEILKSYPESELEIIGHCPVINLREKLTHIAQEIPQLTLRIDNNPVPHQDLITALKRSDFALLPYQNHPAIADKMPTKLFEFAALGIPVLISSNPKWKAFLDEFNCGYSIDFNDQGLAVSQFENALEQTYFKSTPSESILWKTEKLHFQQAIQNLLS
ncbi:hypothetical protein [Algoriphagus sp. A40]|uniref:hypothetical protein n=1 Tax=Algoriphagus sp. A40 TaxID=1945863 RepID=UPI0009875659|nr:hypothetical protein [Algoriphagus sp. A40]OOG73633.1 hypothetical protein B0E43_12280 [Algoriphagus sp. A40]